MENVFDVLVERGLIAQCTGEDKIREQLGKEKTTFYIGFDATASSLHIGHFVPIILMMHLQKAGHRPIALLGTGTTMVGDPSGKTDMRKMLSPEEINYNAEQFRKTISKYIDFSDEEKGLIERNGDWLMELKYIDFLRDVGAHFTVNRMLAAEAFKSRMERGLSFIEFNYMIMQSYDYLHLYRKRGCKIQFGGNDQWSNVLAGVDLIRRVEGEEVHALTMPLLLKSDGTKMGKSVGGALWIDPEQLSPYEFYQYFRNTDDKDVCHYFKILTFVPMDEITEMEGWIGSAKINEAKEKLAFELTKLIHSEEEATKAMHASRALFVSGEADDNMPSFEIAHSDFENDRIDIATLLILTGLSSSKSESKRLLAGGGVTIAGETVEEGRLLEKIKFEGDGLIIKKGKKVFIKITVK